MKKRKYFYLTFLSIFLFYLLFSLIFGLFVTDPYKLEYITNSGWICVVGSFFSWIGYILFE